MNIEEIKMKCTKCNGDMVLAESYKKGRQYWEVYICRICFSTKRVKSGKVPYNKVRR